jgi:hypothetical protein
MGQAASWRRNNARRLNDERSKGVLWHHASVNLVKAAWKSGVSFAPCQIGWAAED